MTSLLSARGDETEACTREPNSGYFHCQGHGVGVAPSEPCVDASRNRHASPTPNASNYDTTLPSNTWSTELMTALDSQLTGSLYWPTIPTDYVSSPSTTTCNGVDPTAPGKWQFEVDSWTQCPWWRLPWGSPGSSIDKTPASSIFNNGIADLRSHGAESTSLQNETTDESLYENLEDWLHTSPARKRQKSGDAASCQETSFRDESLPVLFSPAFTTDLCNSPMSLASNVSFDPPNLDAHPSPRRPASSRFASSSNDAQRSARSPPPRPRPDQRARNRTAAVKCRVKTKAAAAELEAREKAESSRHAQLSATLRGLQADVFALKSEILRHGNCGDGVIQGYLKNTARSLAVGCGGAAAGGGPGDGSPVSRSGSMALSL